MARGAAAGDDDGSEGDAIGGFSSGAGSLEGFKSGAFSRTEAESDLKLGEDSTGGDADKKPLQKSMEGAPVDLPAADEVGPKSAAAGAQGGHGVDDERARLEDIKLGEDSTGGDAGEKPPHETLQKSMEAPVDLPAADEVGPKSAAAGALGSDGVGEDFAAEGEGSLLEDIKHGEDSTGGDAGEKPLHELLQKSMEAPVDLPAADEVGPKSAAAGALGSDGVGENFAADGDASLLEDIKHGKDSAGGARFSSAAVGAHMAAPSTGKGTVGSNHADSTEEVDPMAELWNREDRLRLREQSLELREMEAKQNDKEEELRKREESLTLRQAKTELKQQRQELEDMENLLAVQVVKMKLREKRAKAELKQQRQEVEDMENLLAVKVVKMKLREKKAKTELKQQQWKVEEKERLLVVREEKEKLREKEESITLRQAKLKLEQKGKEVEEKEKLLAVEEAKSKLKHKAEAIKWRQEVLHQQKGVTKIERHDIWDRRQVVYMIALGVSLGILMAVFPFVPPRYSQIFLLTFVSFWGIGSIGFPIGLFGTTYLEKCCSRHTVRLIFLAFSLMVIFVAYTMALSVNASKSSIVPSPSPSEPEHPLSIWWTVGYAFIAFVVFVGQTISWIAGCWTGGDVDADETKFCKEYSISEDLLQRLLERQ